jgi:Ca2+-transporting ATPase
LRSNFDELLVIGLFALLGLELPLEAGMILWINLITDGGPALALSLDPPQKDLMDRPPRDPKEGVLYGRFASIIMSFFTQFLGTGVVFFVVFYVWGGGQPSALPRARTMAFMQATLRELMVVWNCRSERKNAFRVGFTSNKYLLFAVVGSAIVTILVPFTGLFGTTTLSLMDWAIVVPLSLSGLLILPEIFYGRKIWRWR